MVSLPSLGASLMLRTLVSRSPAPDSGRTTASDASAVRSAPTTWISCGSGSKSKEATTSLPSQAVVSTSWRTSATGSVTWLRADGRRRTRRPRSSGTCSGRCGWRRSGSSPLLTKRWSTRAAPTTNLPAADSSPSPSVAMNWYEPSSSGSPSLPTHSPYPGGVRAAIDEVEHAVPVALPAPLDAERRVEQRRQRTAPTRRSSDAMS